MSAIPHIDLDSTIVALATPAGTGAIGVIRLSGKEAISICNQVFKRKDLSEAKSHTIHYGKIVDGNKEVDEVMVSIFKAPKSFTTEDVVEISCHGSPFIQKQIIQLLIDKGARPAKEGEFTMRAFLHGRIDLSQAEAVADLINAESEGARDLALRQIKGGFSEEIKALRQQLIHFASMVELELDFSEEDVEFADKTELLKLVDQLSKVIGELVQSFSLGNAIKNGIATVIAGRPNAGKSTLLNVLLKDERAIVSEIPGTTRDTIEEAMNLNGVLFRFIDTAGIRESTDQIESIGIERTFDKISKAQLIIYLFDVNEMDRQELEKDVQLLQKNERPLLLVGNKIDRNSNLQAVKEKFKAFDDIVFVSSKEKQHLDQLQDKLLEIAALGQVKQDSVLVTNIRHYEALTRAQEALEEVRKAIDAGVSGDLLALDIRRALHYLGEITGQEITTEDLLTEIFSNFCIGK